MGKQRELGRHAIPFGRQKKQGSMVPSPLLIMSTIMNEEKKKREGTRLPCKTTSFPPDLAERHNFFSSFLF
jgi:hypothetical protein